MKRRTTYQRRHTRQFGPIVFRKLRVAFGPFAIGASSQHTTKKMDERNKPDNAYPEAASAGSTYAMLYWYDT